jgi:hypothetical protein
MANLLKKCVIITMLLSIGNFTFADRGIGKKAKIKTLLNINTNSSNSLKSSIALNIKLGLAYRGSISTNIKPAGLMQNSSFITYQKGNTTYIIPYKQKITMPEIKQGYTGLKLIIRSKN